MTESIPPKVVFIDGINLCPTAFAGLEFRCVRHQGRYVITDIRESHYPAPPMALREAVMKSAQAALDAVDIASLDWRPDDLKTAKVA